MNRTELGWAVFLSLPVGVGVWLAVQTTAEGAGGLLAALAGAAAALAVLLLVVAGAIDWSGRSEGDDRE